MNISQVLGFLGTGDAVFVGVQIVNLAAGGIIVAFCKKYDAQVCPFHMGAHLAARVGG